MQTTETINVPMDNLINTVGGENWTIKVLSVSVLVMNAKKLKP